MALGLDQIPESLFPLVACRLLLPVTLVDILVGDAIFVAGSEVHRFARKGEAMPARGTSARGAKESKPLAQTTIRRKSPWEYARQGKRPAFDAMMEMKKIDIAAIEAARRAEGL
jgi:hypothetical protein